MRCSEARLIRRAQMEEAASLTTGVAMRDAPIVTKGSEPATAATMVASEIMTEIAGEIVSVDVSETEIGTVIENEIRTEIGTEIGTNTGTETGAEAGIEIGNETETAVVTVTASVVGARVIGSTILKVTAEAGEKRPRSLRVASGLMRREPVHSEQ